MTDEIEGSYNEEAGGSAAPRWMLLLPVALLAHQGEEWFGGFPDWAQSTLGMELTPSRFLFINTVGFLFFTTGIIGAVRSPRLAWIAAAVSALLFLNGIVHLLATAAFSTYSPGVVTGTLISIPLGGYVLVSMFRTLPRPAFWGSVVAGAAVHAMATLSAIG